MANRDNTKLLQILSRQMRQIFFTDAILAECRLILFQIEFPQPRPDIHRRFLWLGIAGNRASPGSNVYACSRKRLVLCPPWLDRFRSRMENDACPRWRSVLTKFSRNSTRFRSLVQTQSRV